MKKFMLAMVTLLVLGFIGNAMLTYAQNTDDAFAYLPFVINGDEVTATPTPDPSGLNSNYLESYTISDTGFGTEVNVTVNDNTNTRTIESNALPNHNTGQFPNSGNPNTISEQDRTWTFPTEPVFRGIATDARTPGVAINGVKFEPNTAERASCDNNIEYSIEAIQDVTNLGLDFNNAHVQPTGEYHYHGVSELLVEAFSDNQDLVHVAFAADGHLIFYSKSGAYSPSYRLGTGDRPGTNCTYTVGGPNGVTITFGSLKDGSVRSDWEYDASYGDLDECNGITINGQYIYLITEDYPYISRCLMGEFSEGGPGGGGGPGQ
ncbi:MAG: YHYH protein [Chloroflexota bacterium]